MEQPFKYTRAAIKLIIEDNKKIALVIKYMSLAFMTAYFVFVIVKGIGILYINIALASLFVTYTIFDFITYKNRKKHKDIRKTGHKIYRYVSLSIRAVALGANIYGLVLAANNISPISLIFTILSLIFLILNIFLEIIIFIVERRFSILRDSVTKDIETITEPITNARNFFRRVTGKEEITPKEKGRLFIKFKKKVDGPNEKDVVDQEVDSNKEKKPKKKIKLLKLFNKKKD